MRMMYSATTGSTVGQLNDAALFYMQQRGIDRKEAKLLLEFALRQ